MELKAYSIYDFKALTYGTPFFTSTDGLAVRMFTDLVNDPRSTVSRHPKDFALFCIGNFNDADARLLDNDKPLLIMNATEAEKIITYTSDPDKEVYADAEGETYLA